MFYFSLFLLTIGMVGCSKDDNTPSDFVQKDLFVEASSLAVEEGGVVTFKAYDNDRKEVPEVTFYVDHVKVTPQYKFEKRGVYNVVAKKTGYKDSDVLAVLVGGAIAEKLVLQVDQTEVSVGDKVSFIVSADGRSVTNFYIENIGRGLLGGNTWTSYEVGTYTFYAFKEGFYNSDKVTVTVKPKEIKENQYFTIKGVKYAINVAQLSIHIYERKNEEEEAFPYLYTDKSNGKKYQIYELLVMNTDDRSGVIHLIGVYVADGEKKFILPDQADKANVFPLDVLAVINNKLEIGVAANAIENVSIEWIGAYDPDKVEHGPIKYGLMLKDKSVELKYEGMYEALYGTDIKPTDENQNALVKYRINSKNMIRIK